MKPVTTCEMEILRFKHEINEYAFQRKQATVIIILHVQKLFTELQAKRL